MSAMKEKTHTIDDVVESQAEIIRFIHDFLRRHAKETRSGKCFYRRLMIELRERYDFREIRCNYCLHWRTEKHFWKRCQGGGALSRLMPRCCHCTKVLRAYGARNVPPEILADLRTIERPNASTQSRSERPMLLNTGGVAYA